MRVLFRSEDAAQESLARLLRYRESEPARAWKPLLFRIATNVANDHLRQTRTQRHKAHVSLEEQDLSAIGDSNEPTPEQRLADRRQLELVLAAIRSLPDQSSEARRGGKECVSKCRARWLPYH